jgi:hypothetical protein
MWNPKEAIREGNTKKTKKKKRREKAFVLFGNLLCFQKNCSHPDHLCPDPIMIGFTFAFLTFDTDVSPSYMLRIV